MNILLIGSGGREHALAWKIAASPLVERLYCAPGNAGIAQDCRAGRGRSRRPCGRDRVLPLAQNRPCGGRAGGADGRRASSTTWRRPGSRRSAPRRAAAQLETSKGFTKDLCRKYGIPTAGYERFTAAAPAKAYVRAKGAPIVVKADGLAAGKGVVVAQTVAEAEAAIDMMFGGGLGAAGAEVVVEEFLEGEEASFFALCDGETAIPLGLRAGPQARRSTATRARTPAAWAPIRRCRS